VEESKSSGPWPAAGASLSSSLLARPRLRQRLNEGLTARLTLLVAPAGYGKTTLLGQWLREERRKAPTAWVPLSEGDNDPVHLLGSLLAGLQAALPQGNEPIAPPAGEEALASLSYALSHVFERASTSAHRPWLLVLDDYHLIANPAIHQALDTLLGLPTWRVHPIIASRSLPPLAAIARLRVEGRLAELDEADLRFTSAETQRLLESTDFQIEEREIDQVIERTEGWPVALQLIRQAAERRTGASLAAILDRMSGERPLFDYLADQVLSHQPPPLRQFLRRTALLPYLSAGLCNAFLEITDASAVLDRLERGHLFIAPLAGGPGRRYRYHTLFQAFLCRCLEQEEGAQAVEGWHRRVAACLLEFQGSGPAGRCADDTVAAIDHLLAAREWVAAADAIEAVVEMLDWGQLTRMEGWFGRLPPAVLAARPRLLLALGLLRERQCRWSEALEVLTRAEQLFVASHEPEEMARVLHRQAWMHFRRSQYAQARKLGEQALAYLRSSPGQASSGSLREQAHICRLIGGCYAETDDLKQGEQYIQESLRLFRELGDRQGEARALSNLAGTIYLNQGRLAEAIELEQRSLHILDELGSYQVCFVLGRLGDAYRMRGEYEAARSTLERLLQLTDAFQDPMMRGYALYSLGHLHRERGNQAAAHACYEEAWRLGEELQEVALRFEPRLGLALLALAAGDLREAQRHGRAALEQAQEVGFRLFEGQGLLVLGQIAAESGDVSKAEACFREALVLFQRLGTRYDLALAHLYLAHLCRQEGRDTEALAYLSESLALSREHGYDAIYAGRERRIALPLLVRALGETSKAFESEAGRLLVQIGQEAVEPLLALLATAPDQIEVSERAIGLLGKIGDERALPALTSLRRNRGLGPLVREALDRIATAPRPPLRILALGSFQVFRGDLPIPAEAWQRRKSRLLLLYLLAHYPRPVPRDELLDVLWPDLPPDSGAQALNTTFSDLRRILEPYLGKGLPSRYLLRDEETLAFNPAADAWYDVQTFEQAVQAGGEAARQALELYRGDFVPEEPYVDWVLRERERLRALYLNTVVARLQERVRAGAWREGVDLARHILELEPWLEEVARELMHCLAMLGRRSEALHAYQACARVLQEELDAVPSPETRALYEQLKG
jgi:LuxR family maltose regulon positive regulatory protein